MTTHTIFIPETEELENDINAILSQPGVEYVDMKFVEKHDGNLSHIVEVVYGLLFARKQVAKGLCNIFLCPLKNSRNSKKYSCQFVPFVVNPIPRNSKIFLPFVITSPA